MSSEPAEWSRMVFRLSRIPNRIHRRDDAAALVGDLLKLPSGAVRIYSLATTTNPWEVPPSKVATLMFTETPAILTKSRSRQREWLLAADDALVLDNHFWGVTPLNDVEPDDHIADCIAISGLASHPFGSWQEHGGDKTFMWIRDQLPAYTPGVRAIIYGYNTELVDSTSFQGIGDLALGLIAQIAANGGTNDDAKPLVFLAHSLGGIVLKEALCKLANSQDNSLERRILLRCKGAFMFGVPNLGMEQSHILTVVGGKPTEHLIQDISRQSGAHGFLDRLERSFSGISELRAMKIYWAYETDRSPTYDIKTRKMTGPLAILVDPESATGHRVTREPQLVHPIARNHSEMVKYSRVDLNTGPIIGKLREICGVNESPTMAGNLGSRQRRGPAATTSSAAAIGSDAEYEKKKEVRREMLSATIFSLDSPELGLREAQIVDRFEHTFGWIFEYEPFTSWLRKDEGIFWIHGKPGSGKSTLMKLIFMDKLTRQYSHDFDHSGCVISAGFFFNFRGTAIQKTLEGLLRSVLRQAMQKMSDSEAAFPLLDSIFKRSPFVALGSEPWSISRLEEAIRVILNQNLVDLSITFLFDALDEFDGPTDYVCRFLKYLSKHRPGSRTRAKVCFSSRPWETFMTNFGDGLTLRVEDFTRADIRFYCTTNLVSAFDIQSSHLVPRLVTEIVDRASGVFLWASLIVRDIAEVAAGDQNPSLQTLLERLYSLPTELTDYYHYMIQRIPQNLRWQTYALLEAIVRARSTKEYELIYLYKTTQISHCQTYAATQETLVQLDASGHLYASNDVQRQIQAWGGGLVSIMSSLLNQSTLVPVLTVQLMHQTVYEFVVKLDFKDEVLGSAAKTAYENGHSFHFKSLLNYHLKEQALQKQFKDTTTSLWPSFEHGAKAEETSGRSCQQFLESIPMHVLRAIGQDLMSCLALTDAYLSVLVAPYLIRTREDLATYFRLRRYLQDRHAQDPGYLMDASISDHLLRLIALGIGYHREFANERLSTAQFLLEHGYNASRESTLLSHILQPQCSMAMVDQLKGCLEHLDHLAILLLEHNQISSKVYLFRSGTSEACHPIHIALPKTATWLIDHETNVNELDSHGRTPVDIALLYKVPLFSKNVSLDGSFTWNEELRMCYRVITILVERGGKRKKSALSDWINALRVFRKAGFDTSGLPRTIALESAPKTPIPPPSWVELALTEGSAQPQLLVLPPKTGEEKRKFSQSMKRLVNKLCGKQDRV